MANQDAAFAEEHDWDPPLSGCIVPRNQEVHSRRVWTPDKLRTRLKHSNYTMVDNQDMKYVRAKAAYIARSWLVAKAGAMAVDLLAK